MNYLDQDITYLKGVGPARAALFASQMGVHTIGDLLHTYPYRHEDRTKVHRICDLVEGMQNIQLRGHIVLINKVGEGTENAAWWRNFTDGTGYISAGVVPRFQGVGEHV